MSRARHRKTGGGAKAAAPIHHALIIAVGVPHHQSGEGSEPKHHAGKRARGGRSGGKWIQGAIEHPGSLHRALHVPEGEKIPAKKLEKAAHSSNPTMRRRAALAKTLKKMHHG